MGEVGLDIGEEMRRALELPFEESVSDESSSSSRNSNTFGRLAGVVSAFASSSDSWTTGVELSKVPGKTA
jgi:hypothetical protein